MKILFLSDFFLSGQTTHVLELAKQLTMTQHEVHISFGQIHSRLFFTYYAPLLKSWGIPFSQRERLSRSSQFLSRFKPEIIHCHSSTLFPKARQLADRLGIPYVLTCHGLGFSHPKYTLDLQSANGIIAIGARVAEEIMSISPNVAIIPNGIDTTHFVPPIFPSKPRSSILYVGRMDRGRLRPLRKLALLLQNEFGLPLSVIADWDPNIENTRFTPWQVNLVPYLQQSGIVVACGRTAREALSCSNAVLLMQRAYDGIISPSLITRKDFDFSGNIGRYSFDRLKRDLKRLLTSPSCLEKLQTWGRNYAIENLDSSLMADSTLKIYYEILDSDYAFTNRSPKPSR